MVYSGVSVFDGSPVALKFYKQGTDYEAALRRERFVLDRFSDPQHNLVTFLAYINYRGLHCLVMELLHLNIRQVTLQETLQETLQVTLQETLQVTLQVLISTINKVLCVTFLEFQSI